MTRARSGTPTRLVLGPPHQQGQLDGLCGLYAAINALRLAVHTLHILDETQCRALFRAGVELIAARGRLGRVLKDGMDPALRRAVLKRLVARLCDNFGVKVRVRQPFRQQTRVRHAVVAETIAAAVERGAAVMVTLAGAHEHYTVIRGHTAASWLLYDSGGLSRLAKSRCGSPQSRKRHRLDSVSLEVIERAGKAVTIVDASAVDRPSTRTATYRCGNEHGPNTR